MLLRIAKGFHQPGAVAVAVPEVIRQPPQSHAEHRGSQQEAAHGGMDRETAQAQRAVQPLAAQLRLPATSLVAGGHRRGRHGEVEGPQHAGLGLN